MRMALSLSVFVLPAFLFNSSLPAFAQLSPAAKTVTLLEESGFSYTKVEDNVWQIPASGPNVGEYDLRIGLARDLVLLIAKIEDREAVELSEPLLIKLMEFNHRFDIVKFSLSEEMLYARVEFPLQQLDGKYFKWLIEQMVNTVNESYPEIKDFLDR